MTDIRMAIIAPFPGLRETVEEVLRDEKADWSYTVDLRSGDLGEGLEQAKKAVQAGAEVIVSRGGTASLIARNLDVLLVEIEVSAIDILRALAKIENPAGAVGVVGFWNVIYGCEELSSIIGMPLIEIPLEAEADAMEKIRAAAARGMRTVVGDAVSIKAAVRLGLDAHLIESGKEAVYKAIREAGRLAATRRREQERSELIGMLLESSADALVAVDRSGCVTLFNSPAESLFGMAAAEVVGRPVGTVLPAARLLKVMEQDRQEWGEIEKIGDRTLALKLTPIRIRGEVVGALASYQEVSQVQRFEQSVRRKLYAKGLVAKTKLDEFVTVSPAGRKLKEMARRFASVDSNLLITGESGTGKEMLAQGIHNLSRRNKGPFVAVNCAALPENLLESELFGYEEGAFTGARRGGKVGLLELAHDGTVFLDEIGEMPVTLQSRILRVMQEKEVMRLGGDRVIPVNVRIISATNEDLDALIRERKFRRDLYYRLNVLRLHVLPLRERKEDIPALVDAILKRRQSMNPMVTEVSPAALRRISEHPWQGNVRELESILERSLLLAKGSVLHEKDIQEALLLHTDESVHPEIAVGDASLENVERKVIEKILAEEKFNYTRAAKRLGINRTTLWRKLKDDAK